jgi:uncharacterized membrane protein YheB (UPF0754 family)
MNKSFLTNITSILFIVLGYFSPLYKEVIMTIGFFAFSGAITNWLAIHMLFEKVPFLIGSGVIPNRFEDFKTAIRNLIMEQFFTETQIETMVSSFITSSPDINLDSIAEKIDYDKVFEALVQVIIESKFGGMLGMFGGVAALDPLKDPIKLKMKGIVSNLISEGSDSIGALAGQSLNSKDIRTKIVKLVDDRLDELTPKMVKEIIQEMIQKHLGWLVVWGGFFGGLIGCIMSIFTSL